MPKENIAGEYWKTEMSVMCCLPQIFNNTCKHNIFYAFETILNKITLDLSQICHFIGHLDLDQYTPVICYYALFTDPPSVPC